MVAKSQTIRFENADSDYILVVAVNRIVYLSKREDEITLVHLDTGDVLRSTDSMNTIEARMGALCE